MQSKNRNAFSLVEVLVSLSLTGVLAAMLLPMMSNDANQSKLIGIVKDGVSEIARGYSRYQKTAIPSDATTSVDIVNKMNYVRIINDGSQSIEVADVDNKPGPLVVQSYTSVCDATTPCVLLQSGGLMQYDTNASFDDPALPNTSTYNANALLFIIDPDGDGPQRAVSLVMFYNGRISTRRYANTATFYTTTAAASQLPNSTSDPRYVWEWTDG